MGPWSFVGRTDELNRLVTAATSGTGRGLIVSGTAGIGKSRLLRETVSALPTDRFAVFTASSTIATAGLPLGGLAEILPAEQPAGLSPTALLQWAVESLHEQAAGRPIVLAVDDAHLLDPSSAALVYLVARAAHGTVLGTFRSGMRLPVPIRGLWTDDLVDHIELAPLGVAETTALLTEMLGGPIETTSAERLWRLSAGHALLLRELVTAAHAGQEMTRAYGVWRWTGGLEFASSLIDLVDTRVEQLSTEVRTVVELVALGEPIGLDLVIRATDHAPVEAAEERGLIRVLDDDRRHNVTMAHPLYAEVIRRRCPVTRSRRLYARLAALVEEAGAHRREDLLRLAVWRLESDTVRDPRLLLAAGSQALSRFEMALAARLARGALTAGGGFDAAELLATVLALRDEPDEALSVLESVRDEITSDHRRSRWSAIRGLACYWGRGREEAVEDLAADARALTDPGDRAFLHSAEAIMRLHRLDRAEATRLARAVLDEPAATLPARARARCVTAYLHAAGGDLQRSAQAIAEVVAAAPRWRTQLPDLQLALEMARGTQLILAGDLGGIDAIVAAEFADLADAGDFRPGPGYLSVVRAQAARLHGQAAEALRRSMQACAVLRPGSVIAGLAHAERAHASALRGQAAEATAAMADSDATRPPGMGVLYPWQEQARCWVMVCAGDTPGGVRVLRDLVDRLRADGFAGHEIVALHDLVRLGRDDLVVDRLTELTGVVQGCLPALVTRQARAANAGSATELLAVADDFAALGLDLFAAEAAAMAVTLLRTGRSPLAVEASARLGDLLQRCDAVATPALLTGQPALTGRERQIARLAAKGVASRDIAEQLFISTRTVENHLQRVYSKLGVTCRGELTPALRALPDLEVAAGR
ncbi:LuxR C-terminal-related transcriptional regulator [Micromonospora sp. NPDC049679]|uniref:helix-turn-helix transcriptional regulator n=1 Tax=Micromonospora sp. NPDC049679 TaxID=3155920 RepID=UPI0033C974B4